MVRVLASLAIAGLVALLMTAGIALAGQNGEKKVTICHHGRNGQSHTITVAEAAVPAHLNHGDTLGPCPVEYP